MRSLRRRCQSFRSEANGHTEATRARFTPAEVAEIRLVGAVAGVSDGVPLATLVAELAMEAAEARVKAPVGTG